MLRNAQAEAREFVSFRKRIIKISSLVIMSSDDWSKIGSKRVGIVNDLVELVPI